MKSIVQKLQRYGLLALAVFLTHCSATKSISSPQEATIIQQGFFTCFEKGLTNGGKPVWCEASAILYDGQKLLLANDKDMPGLNSSVFYRPLGKGLTDTVVPFRYFTNPLLKKATKFEDFAFTPDRRYIFLTTGFDRVQSGNSEWDGFNSLCYWPTGQEDNVQVVSLNGTDSTSISLRNAISQVLANDSFPKGMPYFKLEGLAVTKNKIYWGVREEGRRFDDFKYKAKIITVSYKMVNERVILDNDFKVLFNMDLPHNAGLSSIEYDPYRNIFWILASLEESGKLGAYLYTASLSDLKKNKMELVRKADGTPLVFTNKAEDICLIDKHMLLVIHDDDRVKTVVNGVTRAENQAAFSVVKVSGK